MIALPVVANERELIVRVNRLVLAKVRELLERNLLVAEPSFHFTEKHCNVLIL